MYSLLVDANARYYAQLLRNRPVESDSTEIERTTRPSKFRLSWNRRLPSKALASTRSSSTPRRDPLFPARHSHSTARPLDPLRSRRNDPSRPSFAFGDFLLRNDIYLFLKRYFLSAQRNHLSLPHLSRARRFFRGPRRLLHRRSCFPPAEERERELDDAMGLSTRKASSHQK